MSGDIGRGVAILLAIILCVAGPLAVKTERTMQSEKYAIRQVLEEFTARIGLKEAITLGDYEDMLSGIACTGAVFDIEMYLGKSIARNAGIGTTVPCAVHIHTPACYKGHNHDVSGCTYHVHSDACYCGGTLTRCYKTDYESYTCYSCGGTGSMDETRTCSTCNGELGHYSTIGCSCKGGKIGIVVPCTKCGGTGVNSKGKECSSCWGSGNLDAWETHDFCGGTGYLTYWYKCAACLGSGTETVTGTCSYCNGFGTIDNTINYYCCNVCGQGSTLSYGQSCGRKNCIYSGEGYLCGINENDTEALCGRIIVDAVYSDRQVLKAGSGIRDIDNRILFTFLDGSTEISSCDIVTPGNPVFLTAGVYPVILRHTGMYLRAGEMQTRDYAVNIIVEKDKEPELTGIRIVNRKNEYQPGDRLEVSVYACFGNREELLDPEEYWDTFDSSIGGEQTVLIGYGGYVSEIRVYVLPNESGTAVPDDSEDHPSPGGNGNQGSGHDTETGGNGGSGGGTGTGGTEPGHISAPDQPGAESGEENSAGEEIIIPAFQEMLGSEELLELLYSGGRIELNEGDAFSISVTVTKESFFTLFGLFGKERKEKYTSGAMIQ